MSASQYTPLLTTFSRLQRVSLCTKSTNSVSSRMPGNPSAPAYEGRTYDEHLHMRKSFLNPGLFHFYKKPLLIHKGHKQWLWNDKGDRFLDLFGGICTVSVGHCHPRVNDALLTQSNKLWHSTNIYMHPSINEYAEKLTSKLPGELKVCYFVNSGSEANDMAVLMARIATERWEVITLRNGYHGGSPFLMGATALSSWRYSTPTGFGFLNSMTPDPYRGPWGGSNCRDCQLQPDRRCSCKNDGECEASSRYVEQLEDVLRYSCPKKGPAAFMVEGIQGVGGLVQYPRKFISKSFDLVKSTGGLCIMDEVQTGFGRTGSHYWGFEGHGVMPDIVTMAKSIGNGFPLAAVVTTPKIAATVSQALHFNTFGGNPLSCAVGSAVLDVIDEEKLQQNAQETGSYLLENLDKLRQKYEMVGDVRGKGFMVGLELVSSKASREPLNGDMVSDIFEDIARQGVLVGKGGFFGNVLRIQPPMCINKDDVDFATAVMDEAFASATKKL